MEQLTDLQIGAVANARQVINEQAEYLPGLVSRINASTGLPWATDGAVFFDVLGDRAADLWRGNGKRIEFALSLGAGYADLNKPPVVCCVCDDGHVVPSSVAFPADPLAVWHVPCATKADALALIAQGDAAVLAALTAAQPAP